MIEALDNNNNQQPSVTILMASYGRLELLKISVDSALVQQYDNFADTLSISGASIGVGFTFEYL